MLGQRQGSGQSNRPGPDYENWLSHKRFPNVGFSRGYLLAAYGLGGTGYDLLSNLVE